MEVSGGQPVSCVGEIITYTGPRVVAHFLSAGTNADTALQRGVALVLTAQTGTLGIR